MKNVFENKEILVTGGCGSIGSELVRHLLKYNPRIIKIFDNDELGLFNMQQELSSHANVRYLFGDVREHERLQRAMKGVQIVFHAAAMKHVPICEYDPTEAVKTNVLGTQNVAHCAREENVEKVISISTDKAVNPTGAMGATKLLGEKIILNSEMAYAKTIFSCIRFGNVMNSTGSVIPLFINQIKNGGPVTITSKEMTRFVMSIPQAAELILKSAQLMQGREIFILKMNGCKTIDLAQALIEEIAPRHNHKPENIPIKLIGKRPGEKLHEELMTEDEAKYVEDLGDMYVIRYVTLTPHCAETAPILNTRMKLTSQNTKLLTLNEIKELLRSCKII